MWDDLARAEALIGDRPRLVIACNYAGIYYTGHLDAWATLHHEMLEAWKEQRAERGGNTDYRAIIHAPKRGVSGEVVPQGWYGSSGLYMAQVALQALNGSGAILCGVPMDAAGLHIHHPGEWPETARYRPGFEAAKADGANIRSMSGWTARLFGEPDSDWLAGVPSEAEAAAVTKPYETRRDEMRVRFLKDTDFTPQGDRRQTTAYRAGDEATVKHDDGALAVARGDAEEVATPTREEAKAKAPAKP